ncbi:MAG: aminotransferase class IV [Planctomycetota bacterium]
MDIAMINDDLLPAKDLPSAHLDRGTFFGDGVYEVIRTCNRRIFALREHLDRFQRSLAAIEISGIDMNLIRCRIEKALDAADIPDAKIYFHVTRGSEPRSHVNRNDLQPNFFLTVSDLPDVRMQRQSGIAVSTYPDCRWKRCHIKSLNLLPNILAKRDAARKGCDEAIFVDENNLITEGAGSAFFAVTNSSLQTAPLTANILPSITREYVIKAAKQIGIQVIEKSFTPDQAAKADELFIAVTTKDLLGTVCFNGEKISSGRVENITTSLYNRYISYLQA